MLIRYSYWMRVAEWPPEGALSLCFTERKFHFNSQIIWFLNLVIILVYSAFQEHKQTKQCQFQLPKSGEHILLMIKFFLILSF